MSKKLSLVSIIILAAVLLLVSCQRAASQAPLTSVATPTRTSATAVAGQETPMGQVQMIGTTQMIQTMTAVSEQTRAVTTSISLPTSTSNVALSTPTPNTFTLITPTGAATTPMAGLTPVVIVPTATPGRPSTYTLMPGEFPYCIARRFNVNQDELLTLNGLTGTNAGNLQAGKVLSIPQSGNPFVGDLALHVHPGTYTVSSANDTIYSIACYYGNIDPTQIIAANSLVSPFTLHINQTLTIP